VEDEPPIDEILHELRRIGVDDEDVPGLVVPVKAAHFLALLREIPAGAGVEAFEALMESLPWPEPAPWDEWPDPGDLFSRENFIRGARLINLTPEEPAEEWVTPPRRIPTMQLALVSLVSPDLQARVDEYRAEVRRDRLAAGVSPEIVETADAAFERARRRLEEAIAEVEADKLERNGPAMLFRLGPEVSEEEARAFFRRVMPREFPGRGSWMGGRAGDSTRGCLLLAKSTSEAERSRIEQWFRGHSLVCEVRTAPAWVWEWPSGPSP
jgi:hypothetical protein